MPAGSLIEMSTGPGWHIGRSRRHRIQIVRIESATPTLPTAMTAASRRSVQTGNGKVAEPNGGKASDGKAG
jgi:hypothetical protein